MLVPLPLLPAPHVPRACVRPLFLSVSRMLFFAALHAASGAPMPCSALQALTFPCPASPVPKSQAGFQLSRLSQGTLPNWPGAWPSNAKQRPASGDPWPCSPAHRCSQHSLLLLEIFLLACHLANKGSPGQLTCACLYHHSCHWLATQQYPRYILQ